MTVFRYDKTFEGLLTAVFDAYSRRMWPDALLAVGEPAPLFTTEEHNVATDPAKAGRVWRGLLRKLPKDVCNMLMYAWLSEEPGADEMLARYMRRVFDGPGPTRGGKTSGGGNDSSGETNGGKTSGGDGSKGGDKDEKVWTDFSDPDVLRAKQLAHKVSNEREHLMQFTRFQKGSDGDDNGNGDDRGADGCAPYGAGATYFAPVSPRYNALPLAIPWFRDRFRDQKWLIYDIGRHYGFYYDLENVTEVTMEDDAHLVAGQMDAAMMAADEKLFQDLWRTYFKSMAIEQRINPRLQRQYMPRRFWKLLTEMQ